MHWHVASVPHLTPDGLRNAQLSGSQVKSLIVKTVQAPTESHHPRGWNSDRSHQRKLKSYQVESHWYQQWAAQCQTDCRVARCYAVIQDQATTHILLEDLDAAGFQQRHNNLRAEQTWPCLRWLANFHACFLHTKSQAFEHQLWPQGCYWHLATRPDELAAMANGPFKQQAQAIDQALNNAHYQTLVHGDAKLANFCFSERGDKVAAVDFQYVGNGCGMKDVAYFLGSCLSAADCAQHYQPLLDLYFAELSKALSEKGFANAEAVENEWRNLFELAWADFHRFILGWAPTHEKNNHFSEKISLKGLAKL